MHHSSLNDGHNHYLVNILSYNLKRLENISFSQCLVSHPSSDTKPSLTSKIKGVATPAQAPASASSLASLPRLRRGRDAAEKKLVQHKGLLFTPSELLIMARMNHNLTGQSTLRCCDATNIEIVRGGRVAQWIAFSLRTQRSRVQILALLSL